MVLGRALICLLARAMAACSTSEPPTVSTDAAPVAESASDAGHTTADGAPTSLDAGGGSQGELSAQDASSDAAPDCTACSDAAASTFCEQGVGSVPRALRDELHLTTFYQKYVDANGVAILSSAAPSDASLISACRLVVSMLAKRDDVRKALIQNQARFVIIGKDEGTAEVPEYGYGPRPQADKDQINQRARGLGGQVASCGEENISCLAGDRYRDESICVHEFSHTISTYGVFAADHTFEKRLETAFERASASGILDDTYRKSSVQEYWAEGVQDWYDTNASASPSNGIHNAVDTRPELRGYDPTLYALIEEVFPPSLDWTDCHAE